MPISNPKPDLYNINAHTKFGENPVIFTHSCPETKIWTDTRRTDGHTDNQPETIILSYYRVAVYKKTLQTAIRSMPGLPLS